jgi:hypothetical protein
MRMLSILFALLATAALAGPAEQSGVLAALPPQNPGQARLFLFREAHSVGAALSARIKIDKRTVAWVHNGETVYVDYNPGTILVGIDSPLDMGSDDVRFTVEAGKSYFMPIAARLGYVPAGAVPYLLSQMWADVGRFCGGGFCTDFVFQKDAEPVIATTEINPGKP